jgi:hypothetical protein
MSPLPARRLTSGARPAARWLVAIATAGIAISACGTVAYSPSSRAPGKALGKFGSIALGAPRFRPPLPRSYSVDALAGDPSANGVWLVASNATQVRLVRWRPASGGMQSWRLGAPAAVGALGGLSIAAGPGDQDVWLGIQERIFRIMPSSGSIRIFPAPREPVSASAEMAIPPMLRKFHNIVGLAVASSGNVAVAESGTSAVAVVSPAGATVSTISLPAKSAPLSLSYDSSGTLAVGLLTYPGASPDRVLLHSPQGKSTTIDVQSGFVSARAGSFLTGAGSGLGVDSVSAASGKVTEVTAPAPPTAGAYRALVGGSLLALPGGHLAYGTASGVAIISQASGATEDYTLPTFSCPAQGGPPQSAASAGAASQCYAIPATLTADGSGDIWYQSSAPSGDVGEIPLTTYRAEGACCR